MQLDTRGVTRCGRFARYRIRCQRHCPLCLEAAAAADQAPLPLHRAAAPRRARAVRRRRHLRHLRQRRLPSQDAQVFTPPVPVQDRRLRPARSPADRHGGARRRRLRSQLPDRHTPDAAAIRKVALVRLGAVTHSVNMEQRYVPLTYTAGSGSLTAIAPANANIAPPGRLHAVPRRRQRGPVGGQDGHRRRRRAPPPPRHRRPRTCRRRSPSPPPSTAPPSRRRRASPRQRRPRTPTGPSPASSSSATGPWSPRTRRRPTRGPGAAPPPSPHGHRTPCRQRGRQRERDGHDHGPAKVAIQRQRGSASAGSQPWIREVSPQRPPARRTRAVARRWASTRIHAVAANRDARRGPWRPIDPDPGRR
jgi:hypothetical protein